MQNDNHIVENERSHVNLRDRTQAISRDHRNGAALFLFVCSWRENNPSLAHLAPLYFGGTSKRHGSTFRASAIFSILLNATFQIQRSTAEM